MILLDTDLAENNETDRQLTHYLYGGDDSYRLKQEIVLGIVGGVRMLHALGLRIRQYHLNEGHAALLSLELLNLFAYPSEDLRPGESPYGIPRVREMCNFTTHTPVDAGHDKFAYELAQPILGDFIDLPTLKQLAGDNELNMTRLALNTSEYVNGVAKRHAETSRHLFPGYRVRAITNGVHPYAWTVSGVTIHQGFNKDCFLSNDYIDKFTEKTLLLSRPPVRTGIPVVDIDSHKIGKIKRLHRNPDTNELESIEISDGIAHSRIISKSEIWGVGDKVILKMTKEEYKKLE